MSQKIIIPKGAINPGETAVIEIPAECRASKVVVAAAPSRDSPRPGPSWAKTPPRPASAAPTVFGTPGAYPDTSQAESFNTATDSSGSSAAPGHITLAEYNFHRGFSGRSPSISCRRANSLPLPSPVQSPRTSKEVKRKRPQSPSPPQTKTSPQIPGRQPICRIDRSASFEFDDEDDIYDDSPVKQKRELIQRIQKGLVGSPGEYGQFQEGLDGRNSEGIVPGQKWRPSPIKHSPSNISWKAHKHQLLAKASNWAKMNDFINRIEGHYFEHDKTIYQKSRNTLLTNVQKVCLGAFRRVKDRKRHKYRKQRKAQGKESFCADNKHLF